MGLFLDSKMRERFAATQRAMLAPLSYAGVEAWQLAINKNIRELFGADHLVAFVTDESGFEFYSDDIDRPALEPIRSLFRGYDDAGFAVFAVADGDPAGSKYVEGFHRFRRAIGSGAYHDEHDVSLMMKNTPLFQATFMRAELRHMLGISTPLAVGEVTTAIGFESRESRGYGQDGRDMLSMLVPAYEAGIQTWRRLAAVRDLITDMAKPVVVLDRSGSVLFESKSFNSMLSGALEPHQLLDAIRRFGKGLHGWQSRRKGKSGRPTTTDATFRSGTATFRFWGSPLTSPILSRESVMVFVERTDAVLPSRASIQERFKLSPRESEVTLLVAQGLTNADIASKLFISVHTVRRHLEQVLKKLGVRSRSAVPMALLRRD